MSLAVLLSMTTTVLGAKDYNLDVVAQTGVPVGGASPVALGQGPSINDSGKVAFIARDQDGPRGRVIVINDEGVVERNFHIGVPATVDDNVQINDVDQVIFRQGFDDGLVSHIQRLDSEIGGGDDCIRIIYSIIRSTI
jgi:hypothetical protein